MEDIQIYDDYILVNGHKIYLNKELSHQLLYNYSPGGAIDQFRNINSMPGLFGAIGLPDFHEGYHFPIGSVAAINLNDHKAVISPEGIGFDINCGVRCLKTTLHISDLEGKMDKIADMLFSSTLSSSGSYKPIITLDRLNNILNRGLEYLYENGEISVTEVEHTESRGFMEGNSRIVGQKAKSRGMAQLGTLGSGNHYLEVQVVDEIIDTEKATVIGLKKGQILISIHTGSRGLGHCICSSFINKNIDCLSKNESKITNSKDNSVTSTNQNHIKRGNSIDISINDVFDGNESSFKKINMNKDVNNYVAYASTEGMKYMQLMASAANFAWANRSMITKKIHAIFKEIFPDIEIEIISDVSHNIAKIETINGNDLLIHRKGSSRILPPGHPDLPAKYLHIGLPVLIGGSMGTSSFIVTGAPNCQNTFYSSPHGAGRIVSRKNANKVFEYSSILKDLSEKKIIVRCNSRKGLVEESPDCYKDIEQVISHSEKIGVIFSVAKLKPVIVVKGD